MSRIQTHCDPSDGGDHRATCPLNRCRNGDFISAPRDTTGGQRIDWDTVASDGLDGFEVTTDQLPIYVDAIIDGTRYPTLFLYADSTANGAVADVAAMPAAFTTP